MLHNFQNVLGNTWRMMDQKIPNSPKPSPMNSPTSLLTRDAKPHSTPQQNLRIWYLFFHAMSCNIFFLFFIFTKFSTKSFYGLFKNHDRLIQQSGSHHTAGLGISFILGLSMSKLEQFWDIVLMKLWPFMVFFILKFRYFFFVFVFLGIFLYQSCSVCVGMPMLFSFFSCNRV